MGANLLYSLLSCCEYWRYSMKENKSRKLMYPKSTNGELRRSVPFPVNTDCQLFPSWGAKHLVPPISPVVLLLCHSSHVLKVLHYSVSMSLDMFQTANIRSFSVSSKYFGEKALCWSFVSPSGDEGGARACSNSSM